MLRLLLEHLLYWPDRNVSHVVMKEPRLSDNFMNARTSVFQLTFVSISQTNFGHLMRFTQRIIPYRHSTVDTATELRNKCNVNDEFYQR